MATATQHRLIGWPGSPAYARPLVPRRKWPAHWIAFALIILLGGALRFTLLDHPAIWADEAATFGRTSGSFADLCDILRDDGFAPLHYELYWWMQSHHIIMTPFMMRLVPAIAGTLTIPAMYFLTRLLTTRKVALLAALFTACSAWLLNYSRDAKMYSDFWLFCTLNYACLVWWFRNKSGIAWWCFVVSGIAMVGIDALGFLVLGVGIIWYLTQPRVHWLSSLAYVLALAVIGLGPAGYYHYFNDWHRGQLFWIDYTADYTAPQLLMGLASSLLFKYQFTSEAIRYAGIDSEAGQKFGAIAMAFVAAVVLIGALPWRKVRPATTVISTTADETGAVVWWRLFFWLLVATVLPVYGWYCASTPNFARPLDWAMAINQYTAGLWPWIIIVAAVVGTVCMASRELAATLATLLFILLAIFIGAALERGAWSDPTSILNALSNLLLEPWFIVAAGGAGAGLIWNYCAPAGFIRARNVIMFLSIVLLVDLATGAVVALAILAMHAFTAHHAFSPGDLLEEWKSLLLYPGILLWATVLPVAVVAYRGSVDIRWRLRRWFGFLSVIGGVLLLCEGIALLIGHPVQSLWVPRYLGMVWPPMAIGLVILIARLPTRGLRITAIVVIVGLNLFNFGLRVLANNEPPVDKIVDDIAVARAHPERMHVIIGASQANFGPGGGSMNNQVGAYYLELDRQRHNKALISPMSFHDFDIGELWDFDVDLTSGRIHQVLAQQPKLNELIVWTTDEAGASPPGDDILPALGTGWKLASEDDECWTSRDHWSWRDLFTNRRRVYRRKL